MDQAVINNVREVNSLIAVPIYKLIMMKLRWQILTSNDNRLQGVSDGDGVEVN